jgi:hypothetical protein
MLPGLWITRARTRLPVSIGLVIVPCSGGCQAKRATCEFVFFSKHTDAAEAGSSRPPTTIVVLMVVHNTVISRGEKPVT